MNSYYFVILIFLLLPFNCKCLKNLTQRQFKNERQAIALIREGKNLYRLARPELIDDQFKFSIEKGESIQYFCAHGTYSTKKEPYQYQDCGHPPNIVLRTCSADDEINKMWPGEVIYQIGYELKDENDSQATDETNLKIVDETDSKATGKTNFKNSMKSILHSINFHKKDAKPEPEPDPIQPPTKPNGPFVPLIQFVYDAETSLPIFVKYDITSAQSLAMETSYMLVYNKMSPKTGGEMDMDKFYENDIHKTTFALTNTYISQHRRPHILASNLYLVKKQLVPHDDLLLFPWKPAAFYEALTAPIWNVLKTKWELVEQFIRRLANVLGALEVYTGVRKSIKWWINDEANFIELHDKERDTKLSVPSYFWKAIIHRKNKLGVLIVMNNQVFASNYENLCKDISSKHYLPFVNKDMRSGTIYVCELNNENMKKVLSHYPNFNVNQMELDDLQSNIHLDVWKDIIHNIY